MNWTKVEKEEQRVVQDQMDECTQATEGALYFDKSNALLYRCNGNIWIPKINNSKQCSTGTNKKPLTHFNIL